MPIDPTPEGGELMHQPVVKPFPISKTDQQRDERDHPSRDGRPAGRDSDEDDGV